MHARLIKVVALVALLSSAVVALPQGLPLESDTFDDDSCDVDAPEPSSVANAGSQPSNIPSTVPQPPSNKAVLQPSNNSSTVLQDPNNPNGGSQLLNNPPTVSQPSSNPNAASQPSNAPPTVSQPPSNPNAVSQPSNTANTVSQPSNNPNAGSTTPDAGSPPADSMCGNNQNTPVDGTPWAVANSMYGAGSMVGTSCTNYDHVETGPDGNKRVVWGNTVHIQNIDSTNNICKGYANVALLQNLQTSISSISSIPATYDWTRTNSSPFKGNIVFDFILGDTKGDSTSSACNELMLWLEWEGGQLPIGWDAGPAVTIDSLFGTSWKVYEGKNLDNGMTVHSALPDTQFSGSFSGDLKQWFEALVQHGRFSDATFVNIGNAGSEIFWGDSVLEAHLGVQINLS